MTGNPGRSEVKTLHNESERIYILKVWFTVMVLFIHSYSESVNFADGSVPLYSPDWWRYTKILLSNVVCMCAIPGFFFLSAFFLYRHPFGWMENLIRKIKRLVIPYLMINSFWIAVIFIAQHLTPPLFSRYFSNPDLIVADWSLQDWLSAYFGSAASPFPFLYPLWFLRDLFIMNILAPAYDRIVRLLGRYSLLIFTALWLLVDSTHIFFLDIRAVCFWGIGCCFAKNNFSLSSFDRMNKALLSVLYIGLTAAYGVLIGSESVIESVIYRLGLTVGIVFWYVCATGLKGIPKRLVLSVSRYSFLIYLFHELNLTALKKLLAGLLPLTIPFQIAEYFCVPCIILLFCTGLSILLERIAPGVFVVLNGGRALRYTKNR